MDFAATAIERRGKAGAASRVSEWAIIGLGGLLILLALLADHAWLDHHLLPQKFVPRGEQILIWQAERGATVFIGLGLIFPVRRRIARLVGGGQGGDLLMSVLGFAAAGFMAVLVSEAVLRMGNLERLERWTADEEPHRGADRLLGWVNSPNRVGIEVDEGRKVRYDLDMRGRRVANLRHPIDPARPSILFTGESMLFGYRLNWNETAAAQVGAMRGLQTVNLSVNGYAADQEWLRLRQELPHFAQPKVVVALFSPMLIERSLDRHRARLDADLRWHAAEPGWRLGKVLRRLMLYHSAVRIEAGVAATRASLVAIVTAARARGAQPLILIPEFGPEQPIERRLREQVVASLPSVRVELDPAWAIPGDGHPDARANRAISRAVLAALSPKVRP